MSCCSRKKTKGIEPQQINQQVDQPSEKIKPNGVKESPIPSEIEYSITVKTGNYRNSNTDGPVYIQMFGENAKQTDEILLLSPFKQDSLKTIQVKAIDIGKPQRIIIRHEDQTNGWFIDYIDILAHRFQLRFMANRWLDQSKHDRKLSAELFGSEQPAEDYNIEVRTGSEQTESFDSPVYVQIYGTTATTPKLFLQSPSTLFTKNSTGKFNITSNNVGEIQKVVIGHENLGTTNDWYLESVNVQTTREEHPFTVNQWISPTKGNKQLFVELTHQSPRASSSALQKYSISGKIVDVNRAAALDNLQLSIVGSSGRTDQILLKNLTKFNEQSILRKGSSMQFEVQEKDIGSAIESLTIGFDDKEEKAALLFEFIDIKYKETVYHFRVDAWLSSRLGSSFSWITIKPETTTDDIHYKVIVRTGESDIDANVILCIYGDRGTTRNLALRTTKDGLQAQFDQDSRLEFDLREIDVGKINKINIGHDGTDNEREWFLKSIEIEKNDEHYLFKADRWLNERTGTFIDLSPEQSKPPSIELDQAIYKITIVTSSADGSGTDSGVFMTIYGDKDRTNQFQLLTTKRNSDMLLKPGETSHFEIQSNDVGTINKINIGQDGKGLHPVWHLDSVQIQKGSEIFKFNANQVLDYSTPDINLIPMSSEPSSRRSTTSEDTQKISETTYQVLGRFRSLRKSTSEKEALLYLIIVGTDGRTEKLVLSSDKKGAIEFTRKNVGKISKILLGQDENSHGVIWHVDHLTIKHDNETIRFTVDRSIKQGTEIEVTPSAIDKPSNVVKMKDVRYEIKTTTGQKAFEGDVIVHLRGDLGIITIPLTKNERGTTPFQSKAVDVFTTQTTDIGKIRRLTLETTETRTDQIWYLKKIQITKGNELYYFNTNNVRLDSKKQKLNLSPITKRVDDYVQSELRRLRESLRTESSKMHPPSHKVHEPFVYNDLSPYFDTSSVEKAIHAPLENPPGYYTRLTALRVVEPWEAYGMDYGVSYELLKNRGSRNRSAKRSSPTQTGLIMLPPFSLPYGGQITYVNPVRNEYSRASSASTKRRFSSRKQTERVPITTAAT